MITILSLYFYISIPLVFLVWVLIVGGAYYVFFLNGSLPVKFSLVLVAILMIPLVVILRPFLTRFRDPLPGRKLERLDASELWILSDQVAGRVGVRRVDRMTITPFAEIPIREQGSILKKLRRAGQRELRLGMGLLPMLSQGQLVALLAHEYGHFSKQGSAGGDLAYPVVASLDQMGDRLTRGRTGHVYNPAWWFVDASHGSSA